MAAEGGVGKVSEDKINGVHPTTGEWLEHQMDTKKTLDKVTYMHDNLQTVTAPISSLSTSLNGLTIVMHDLKKSILDAAIGIDRVPIDVTRKIVNILGGVIIGLVFVIVFLLTGIQFGWIKELHF